MLTVIDDDGSEHRAPVGAWFAAQFVTRVIIPQLALDAQK